MRKLTIQEFVQKAKLIHGCKYDYSKVKYCNNKVKVCIICPEHGEFWISPNNLLTGGGCSKCANETKMVSQRLTTQEFIEKAIEVHGKKYDYSKVKYFKSKTKVCIICPEHGEFWQTPSDHLQHKGCSKCANERIHSLQKLTTGEFIKRAKEIHGNKYIYSNVEYNGMNNKVCIICPEHGEFWQTPHDHLKKSGCAKCSQSHLEKKTEEILLDNGIKYETQKHFKWLGRQSLDFYLPEYNIAIECQGEQHFKPIDFAGKGIKFAENLLKKNIERDKNKLRLCENNKIKLFYVNYNENVINKINQIIKLRLN